MKRQQNNCESPLITLKEQYRMHPEILKLPNTYFYGDSLKTARYSAMQYWKRPILLPNKIEKQYASIENSIGKIKDASVFMLSLCMYNLQSIPLKRSKPLVCIKYRLTISVICYKEDQIITCIY